MSRSRRDAALRLLGPVLLFVGAFVALWFVAIHDHVVPRNFGVVEPGRVYRAARLTPSALSIVHQRHAIRTLIDFGAYDNDPDADARLRRTCAALGIRHVPLTLIGDGTGNPNNYVAALAILANPANHPVLLNCAAGAQRTGACVMLYRHVIQGRPYEQAYPEALAHGHDPGDNWKLPAYLAEYAGAIETAHRTGVPIAGFPVPDIDGLPGVAHSRAHPERRTIGEILADSPGAPAPQLPR